MPATDSPKSDVIRAYEMRDRARVEELLVEGLRSQEALAAQVDPPEDAGFFPKELEEHVSALAAGGQGWWVWVAEDDSPRGCMWMRHDVDPLGPYLSVRQLIVDGAYRGRGIGTQMLRHADGLAESTAVVMLLISGFVNNRAIGLYRRLGFSDLPGEHREDPNPNHVVLWKPFLGKTRHRS